MKHTKHGKGWTALFVCGLAVLLSGGAGEAASGAEIIGRVKVMSGEAFLWRGGERTPITIGEALQQGDAVETGAAGSLGITFNDSTTFALGPETRISLDEFQFDSAALEGNLLAGMERGTLSVVTGEMTKVSPEAVKVRTPRAILGVRGTEFLVRVEPAKGKRQGG